MNNLMSASLILALFLSLGCAKKNEFKAPPPPGVTVQFPEQKTVTVFDSFPGRLVAHDVVEIRARIKGYLQSIDFVDGQRVKKGDLLFTIEPEAFEAAVESAEAKLAQAQAADKLAQATLERTQKAYKTEAVSQLDVLTAEANKQSAEGMVEEAQAALENARLNLSYTKISAPISGRMARRSLSVGNLVGDSGSTLLTTLVVESPMDVFFNVDERTLIPYLQQGVRNSKPGESIPPVKLELANGQMHDEEGIVDYIDPEIDPATGTLQARAIFPNQGVKLLPGLYGKILLPKEIEDALLIPDLAVQQDMAGTFVLTVNAENKVESVYITKGPLVGTQRVVMEDPTKDRQLTIQDRIVVNGIQRARPGIPVTPTDAQTPAAAPASN